MSSLRGDQIRQPVALDEEVLKDGTKMTTLADGHHKIVDKDGNVELDDLDSDKSSYCEEVDEVGADGQVHRVKKWHHHTMDHFKNHGKKYGALSMVGLALGLGLGLGLAYYIAKKYVPTENQNIIAAKLGTTLGTVSVIPSKGESSSRRRLDVITPKKNIEDPFSLDGIRAALKVATATPVENLDELSDYHLQMPAGYSVSDPSSTTINTLNQITCYLDQLRVSDIGLNLEKVSDGLGYANPNPNKLPYVAVVDPELCGVDESSLKFAVNSEGPPGGGPGIYNYDFIANIGTQIINGEVTNVMGDCGPQGCRLLTSSLSYYFPSDGYNLATKGALKVDKSNPSLNSVKFAETYDFEFSCGGDQSSNSFFYSYFDDTWMQADDYAMSDDWTFEYDDFGMMMDDFSWDDWDDDWNDDWDDDLSFDDDSWWNIFRSDAMFQKDLTSSRQEMRKFTSTPNAGRANGVAKQNEDMKAPNKKLELVAKKAKHTILKLHRQPHLGKSKLNKDKYVINPTAPLRRVKSKQRTTAPSNRHKDYLKVKSTKIHERNQHIKVLRAQEIERKKSVSRQENDRVAKAMSFFKKAHKKENSKSKWNENHLRKGKHILAHDNIPGTSSGDFSSDPNFYNYYLSSEFNPYTFEGAATCKAQGEASYRLLFSENAFVRSKNGNDNNARCVDFSIDNRLLITTSYKLFNADDGSEVVVESGYLIQKEINGVLQEAYVDYWGAWPFYSYNPANGQWSFDDSWLVDGASVEKVDYATGNTEDYTLKLVEAKLLEVTTFSVTLDEIKDAPLMVMNYAVGEEIYKISWDGEKLVKNSDYTTRCITYDYNQYFDEYPYYGYNLLEVDTSHPLTWHDCYCLDTSTSPATIKRDGSYQDYSKGTLQVEMKLTTPTEFVPSSQLFPYLAYEGFLVSTEAGSVYAEINLEYESIQTLYGVYSGKYTRGDKIRQASSGATGVVAEDSPMSIRGYTCGGGWWYGGCLTLSQASWWACSEYSHTSSYLLKGMKLTQGSVVGFVDADWVYPDWEGIPVIMQNANEKFDLTLDIEVSMPSVKIGELSWYTNVTGTLTAPTAITLSYDWQDVVVVGAANCTSTSSPEWDSPESFLPLDVTISNGGTGADVILYGSIYESWQWAYVSNPGSGGCDSNSLTATVAAPTGYTCSSLPTLSVSCVGYSDKSDRVKVKLPRDGEKFEYTYNYEDTEQIMKASSGSNSYSSIGWSWWIEENMGEIYPITGSSTLTYRAERVVPPSTTVPSLLCYEDCPDASKFNDCEDATCKRDRPTRLSKTVQVTTKAKDCVGPVTITTYPTWTFTNIGGNPSMNVTWQRESKVAGTNNYNYKPIIRVGDVGMNCSISGSNGPTVFFADSSSDISCATKPNVTITCQEGNDAIDFRQANVYTFDSDSGILFDSQANQNVIFSGTNNTNYAGDSAYNTITFGPFFPDDNSKIDLACPEDPDFVCMRDAETVLPKLYFYELGRWSQRALLVNPTNGNALESSYGKTLLYSHSGETSNTGKNYDGSSMFITYNGPHEVEGLPQFCLSESTGQATNLCLPKGSEHSTTNGNDISIKDDIALTDSFGNKYYMKPLAVSELYPVSSDTSICNGLDFNDFHLSPPKINDVFDEPDHMCNEDYPSSEELNAYLNGGFPQVIGGLTRQELANNVAE